MIDCLMLMRVTNTDRPEKKLVFNCNGNWFLCGERNCINTNHKYQQPQQQQQQHQHQQQHTQQQHQQQQQRQ